MNDFLRIFLRVTCVSLLFWGQFEEISFFLSMMIQACMAVGYTSFFPRSKRSKTFAHADRKL